MATLAEIIAERTLGIAPWMAPLSEESRETVRRNARNAPALSTRQQERIRLLFSTTQQIGGLQPKKKRSGERSP